MAEEMTFAANIHVAKNGQALSFDARITFTRDPKDYGNGYYMVIKSKEEPFGEQGYDIRYDKDFCPDRAIAYIVDFYSWRYDGKKTEYDTKWKLTGIRVFEADFEVMDS